MSHNKAPIFKGISTALVTPFLDSGDVDFNSLAKLIDFQIENGIAALTVCGTTGEASTLNEKEQTAIVEFTVKRANGKIPVIAGSGSNCTSKAISLSKSAQSAGADALLIVTPYYNKASDEGLTRHYLAIADCVDIPMILYNVPSRTGIDIPVSVYRKLSTHENIVGLKEARGNTDSVKVLTAEGVDLQIYSGNDRGLCDMLDVGALGCISVASNIVPKEMSKLCDLYFSGERSAAIDLECHLSPIFDVLFCEVNPIPVKYALSLMNKCKDTMRLPLCPPSSESADNIKKALKMYNLT